MDGERGSKKERERGPERASKREGEGGRQESRGRGERERERSLTRALVHGRMGRGIRRPPLSTFRWEGGGVRGERGINFCRKQVPAIFPVSASTAPRVGMVGGALLQSALFAAGIFAAICFIFLLNCASAAWRRRRICDFYPFFFSAPKRKSAAIFTFWLRASAAPRVHASAVGGSPRDRRGPPTAASQER